jgi:hypothetical protein
MGKAARLASEVNGAQPTFLAEPQPPITVAVRVPTVLLEVSISPQDGEIVVP